MDAIIIARLAEEGQRFKGEDPPEMLEVEADDVMVSVGPVRHNLMVTLVGGTELLVRGDVSCEVVFRCSRCAQPFTHVVSEAPYIRSYELHDETESVDLTPDIREATLLAFPAYPVCRPDCLGLCPKCGDDLNKGACTCAPEPDARWGGLDGLDI